MEMVKVGRKWEINTREEYEAAMKTFDENDFVAEMSDSYQVTLREQAEVARQRMDVIAQARAKGIIE